MGDFFTNLGTGPAIIILVMIVMVFILLFSLINTNMRLARLERKYKMFMKGKDGQSLEREFVKKFAAIDKLSESDVLHSSDIHILKKGFERIFSKYGVEKYDAFDDVGGKLSFALAMLDKNNTGLVLNAIHSRDNCFLYLKEIVKGESYVMLSQEEVEALRKAVNFNMAEEAAELQEEIALAETMEKRKKKNQEQ
jgi:hypothetical protein